MSWLKSMFKKPSRELLPFQGLNITMQTVKPYVPTHKAPNILIPAVVNTSVIYFGGYILDINSKLAELKSDSSKLEQVNKELEIITNLHPLTIEVLQLAYDISKSDDLNDLKKMDELIKKRLFSNKLEDIINDN